MVLLPKKMPHEWKKPQKKMPAEEGESSEWLGPWLMIAALEDGPLSKNMTCVGLASKVCRAGGVPMDQNSKIPGRREAHRRLAQELLQQEAQPRARGGGRGRPKRRGNQYSRESGVNIRSFYDLTKFMDAWGQRGARRMKSSKKGAKKMPVTWFQELVLRGAPNSKVKRAMLRGGRAAARKIGVRKKQGRQVDHRGL